MNTILAFHEASRIEGKGDGAIKALDRLSLSVGKGEFLAVMGPSGSGKSTLLDLAGGLRRPNSGQVITDGVDIGNSTTKTLAKLRRCRVGYLFQDINLIPSLTAAENVSLPLELGGIRLAKAKKLAHEALAEIGLESLADRYPDDLSGGQRQRVALARALIGDRTILLADEPTGALDSATGEAVLELLRSRADAGATVLLVTHEQRFAAYADRIIYLRDGQIDGQVARSPEPLHHTIPSGHTEQPEASQ